MPHNADQVTETVGPTKGSQSTRYFVPTSRHRARQFGQFIWVRWVCYEDELIRDRFMVTPRERF